MKYSLWCYLFGHKFVTWSSRSRNGEWMQDGRSALFPTDNCVRCGLTKKEAGIIS